MAPLNDIAKACHKNSLEHGWWGEGRSFPAIVALIHSEVSEALEAWRDTPLDQDPFVPGYADTLGVQGTGPLKPVGVPSELADIIIRVLDAAAGYGIDIDAAVAEKMAYNETRPFRHGGKRA